MLPPCPHGQSPRPLSSSRPLPRAWPPPSRAAGPPAIIPSPLQRTGCRWVQPHQPGRHILSLLSPSNGTTGTKRLLLQGTLQRPLGVSEGCLGAASAVPLPPALQLSASRRCAPPCRPAPRGWRFPCHQAHSPPCPPRRPPTCLSLPPGPALPGVIPQALCPFSKINNICCPPLQPSYFLKMKIYK